MRRRALHASEPLEAVDPKAGMAPAVVEVDQLQDRIHLKKERLSAGGVQEQRACGGGGRRGGQAEQDGRMHERDP